MIDKILENKIEEEVMNFFDENENLVAHITRTSPITIIRTPHKIWANVTSRHLQLSPFFSRLISDSTNHIVETMVKLSVISLTNDRIFCFLVSFGTSDITASQKAL